MGDVIAVVWQAPATVPRWEWQFVHVAGAVNANPQGALVLTIILSSSHAPDAKTRVHMQAGFKSLGPKLRMLVAVALGNGMWVSVVRTIVRGLLLLSGQSRQHQVVATLDEGLDLIRDLSSTATPSRTEVRQMVNQLLDTMKQAPAQTA